MKISDVLKDEEDDEDCDFDLASKSLFPCFYLPCTYRRTFSKLKSKRDNLNESRRKIAKEDEEMFDSVGVSSRGDDGLMEKSKLVTSATLSSGSEMVESSGKQIGDVSFNIGLGVGVGLAFVTAASKNELNKMIELRTEMETLLREVKEEIHRNNTIFKPSESSDISLSTITSYPETRSMNDHPTTKCDKAEEEDHLFEIDQLEAEVEAELERLQLRLDVEEFSEHLQQQLSEKEQIGELEDHENGVCPSELEQRLQELLKEREQEHKDELFSSVESSSLGEIEDEHSNGVSPGILEIKLHELLEARQQDRIEELESALEDVKHKLHQKEIEISWWKDIAELISQHVNNSI